MNLELITALRAEIDQLKGERNKAQVEVQWLTARVAEMEATPVDWDAQRRRADELEAEVERLTAALTAVDQDAAEARMERDEAKAKAAELQEDHMFLEALETAGVDNWDGYSYAHEIFEEWTGGERK